MNTQLITDALWTIIAPLLPPEPPKPKGGRPRSITDRAALTGIVFVLKSGIPWEMLPQEVGCGSGMTCWRRLRDWQQAGVWRRLHRTLRQRLQDLGRIDWTRASLDSASVPAPGGRTDRQGSDESRQVGHEAPYRGRPHRCAVGRDHLGVQCARLQAARRSHRRHPTAASAGQAPWATTPPSRETAC